MSSIRKGLLATLVVLSVLVPTSVRAATDQFPIVTRSVDSEAGHAVLFSVPCPAGAVALSGGVLTSHRNSGYMSQSYPSPDGRAWIVEWATTAGYTETLVGHVVCGYGINGYEIVSVDAAVAGVNVEDKPEYADVQMNCPGGKRVISGGILTSRTQSGLVSLSFPSSEGTWKVVWVNQSFIDLKVVGMAVCAEPTGPLFGYERVVRTDTVPGFLSGGNGVGPGLWAYWPSAGYLTTADCGSKRAISGGAAHVNGHGEYAYRDGYVVQNYPATNRAQWAVEMGTIASDDNHKLAIAAICVGGTEPPRIPSRPADTLPSGQSLSANQSLLSSGGKYRASMQTDGNFVVRNAAGDAIWDTGTWDRPGAVAVMQTDGNLVLYQSNQAVWSSNTWDSPGARLVMQSDGNLVLWTACCPRWSTNTGGR